MGTFAPTHWLIVIVLVAIFCVPLYMIFSGWRHADEPYGTSGPFGFAGWLILLVLNQTATPLNRIIDFIKFVQSYSTVTSQPFGQATAYAQGGLFIALFVFEIIVTVAMYRKRRTFPRLFLYQFCAVGALLLIDAVLYYFVAINVQLNRLLIGQEINNLIATVIWVLYVFKSKRVRGTFVR